jgi:hypothetical protein
MSREKSVLNGSISIFSVIFISFEFYAAFEKNEKKMKLILLPKYLRFILD